MREEGGTMRDWLRSRRLRLVMAAISLVALLFLGGSAFSWVRLDDGSSQGDEGRTTGQGDISYGDPDMPEGKGPGTGTHLGGTSSTDTRQSLRGKSYPKKSESLERKQLASLWTEMKFASRFWTLYLVQR